ncbi:putative uridine nucleosidase [Arachis hypogaea]|nr:putative uridine nucleosidase [Arachis hypogaea]
MKHRIGSDREKLASSNGKFAQYLTKILDLYFSYPRVYLHDSTAFSAAVDPTLVTCMEGSVRVQTSGITRGLTILYNKHKSFTYALTDKRNAIKDKESPATRSPQPRQPPQPPQPRSPVACTGIACGSLGPSQELEVVSSVRERSLYVHRASVTVTVTVTVKNFFVLPSPPDISPEFYAVDSCDY